MKIDRFIELWNEGLVKTPESISVDLTSPTLRQFTKERKERHWLSMSQLGKPAILLAMYQAGMCKPKFLETKQNLKQQYTFFMGDVFEEMFLALYEAAGGTVEHRQYEVSYSGVLGHIDAVVDGNHLIDCKALGTFGYDKFTKYPQADTYYQSQMQLYFYCCKSLEKLGVKRASWVVLNKGTGYLTMVSMKPDEFYLDRADYIIENLPHVHSAADVKRLFEPPPFEVDHYTRKKLPPFALRQELSSDLLEWVYTVRDN